MDGTDHPSRNLRYGNRQSRAAVTAATKLDALIALTLEAAEQLQRIEAARACWLAELSAEHANTRERTPDAHLESLLDRFCQVRTLAYVQRSLQHRTVLLCEEGAQIRQYAHAGRNDHCDKIRHHHARLLHHVDQMRACLASLQPKTT